MEMNRKEKLCSQYSLLSFSLNVKINQAVNYVKENKLNKRLSNCKKNIPLFKCSNAIQC